MDRRILRLSAIAVAAPAIVLAWVGVRTISAERAEARRKLDERVDAAEAAVAERADALIATLEEALAEAERGGTNEDERRDALRAIVQTSPLAVAAFGADASGRFILPRDRPPPPPPPAAKDADEVAQWRRLTDRADELLARGAPSDAAVAVTLLGVTSTTFADAELRASLLRRLADAHLLSGDEDRAVAVLRGILADPSLATAREPLGAAIAPVVSLRLAELHVAADETEAAVGVIADLVANVTARALRIDDVEADLVLARAVAFLVTVVPIRAAAIVAAARADAELLTTARADVIARLADGAGAERVVIAAAPGAKLPRLFVARRGGDGAVAGVEVGLGRLGEALAAEASALEEALALRIAVLDDSGASVLDATGDATGGDAPPPGTGRYLAETVPTWRVVAAPVDGDLAPWGSLALWVRIGAISLAVAVTAGAVWLAAGAASREVELARMRQEFVESVTHELRTPITSVRSLAEVLLRADGGLPPDRVKMYHESIARESVRLASLVENVLKAARLERGATELAVEMVHPSEIVDEALATFGRLPEGEGRTVDVVDSAAPDEVRIDRAAAVQALLNLVSNAAKYSPTDATIDVTVEPLARHGGSSSSLFRDDGPQLPGVRFLVRDRGEGVPDELAARLFEPFFRARPDDPSRRGTGLGLRVCRGLARGHGGDVRVQRADDGPGSVFVLDLPSQPEPGPRDSASRPGGGAG